MQTLHHEIVIIGGGTAGVSVAARLRLAGETDIAVIEPSSDHYYQPYWTLVGGGIVKAETSRRAEADVMPQGVKWLQDAAEEIDPEAKVVTLRSGAQVEYDQLVVCPGIQLDWDGITGLPDALGTGGVSSNYRFDLAPKMWEFIRGLRSGSAVFGMPSGPIKCGGAPQKIAYLAADYWRQQGVLDAIDVHLVLPSPKLFGVPEFNATLEKVVERYGIQTHLSSEITEIRPESREVVVHGVAGGDGEETLHYDVAHLVPPQSAPDWVKKSSIAVGDVKGWVEVDKHTLQHTRFPDVFSLGDVSSAPNSKTGAAIRKQAPVVVANVLAHRRGAPLVGSYEGYSSCPITTARDKMLLCEFDYSMTPHPSIPLIDTTKERTDMWYLKKYGLPFMYWNLMLKGRA